MKKGLQIIFLIVFIFYLYQYQDDVRSRILPVVAYVKEKLGFTEIPCEKPIPYALGGFDEKFNISKSYFLSAIAEAELIWEKPFGRELFNKVAEDSPRAGKNDILKVNLIYDYRQQATSKLAGLGITVEGNRASYDSLKTKFLTLKTQYEKEKNIFDERMKNFNHIQTEAKELEAMQKNLNNKVDEINAMVVALNRLASTLNLSVEKYNTTNVARGESFEEGVYSSDGENAEINIYEFSNRDKLVRVLAHEFGHALGLGHVADPKAIMYEFNKGNSKKLAEADMDALKNRCGIMP